MEIIRVDLDGIKPSLIPDEKLQFKGKRYYFKDTYKLKKGEIFMSPLDLNIENGKIERPLKPMIRFGMPIFDKKGKKQGVLLLNYLGKKLIQDLERLSIHTAGHFMLLNNDGYWLKGMKSEDEWGFMFQDRYDKKFQQQHLSVWEQINNNNKGQILNDFGLITYTKIYLLEEGIKSSSGSPKPFGQSIKELSSRDFFWVLLSHIPSEKLYKKDYDLICGIIIVDLILLLLFGRIIWQLIGANTKRQLAEETLKKTNQQLDKRVRERTEALLKTNEILENEVGRHKKTLEEKNKIESQIRQTQKMEAIGNMASGIAHDFNNMLAVILGNSEMVLSDISSDNPFLENITQIQKAALRSKELVIQILAFSRKEKSFKRIAIYLCRLVEDSMISLRQTIPSTIDIKVNIPNVCKEDISNCEMILMDPNQFHQIMINICNNAIFAMNEKGILEITVSNESINENELVGLKSGKYQKLVISDTGSGMSQRIIDKIFDPFFTTKGVGEGTGMGLSVVHGIIENNIGKIFVESELGKGSKFIIYFPICDKKIEIETSKVEDLPTGTERILIIDDEEAILLCEEKILEKLGYNVTACSDSTKAFDLIQNNLQKFDLIITDQTMPGFTGIELAEKVFELNPSFPVIICTGFSSKISKDICNKLGIKEIINKPFKMNEIAKSVRRAVKK